MTLIKTSSSRENFTKHGMHLNNLGKSNVASQIVKCIHTMINKVVKTPIKLDWRAECDEAVNDPNEICITYTSTAVVVNTAAKRIRRKPITRSMDFLWED